MQLHWIKNTFYTCAYLYQENIKHCWCDSVNGLIVHVPSLWSPCLIFAPLGQIGKMAKISVTRVEAEFCPQLINCAWIIPRVLHLNWKKKTFWDSSHFLFNNTNISQAQIERERERKKERESKRERERKKVWKWKKYEDREGEIEGNSMVKMEDDDKVLEIVKNEIERSWFVPI